MTHSQTCTFSHFDPTLQEPLLSLYVATGQSLWVKMEGNKNNCAVTKKNKRVGFHLNYNLQLLFLGNRAPQWLT